MHKVVLMQRQQAVTRLPRHGQRVRQRNVQLVHLGVFKKI
jgi:hypothetical protein